MPSVPLRLGTRRSALARWQAEWVAARLAERCVEVELVPIVTTGDRRREAIGTLGGRGVFTKEIQQALADGRIDLAVHSLKDLPTEPVAGLCLAGVPERAAIADVLVSNRHGSLDELPEGAIVGTGSPRRRAQLLHVRPGLVMKDVRGNVETRLGKLDRGDYDAVVLAEAGLTRLGLAARIAERLPPSVALPAVGQGALGLEARGDDDAARQAAALLDHAPSHQAVLAERAMLAALHGGCLAPIAAWARPENGRLVLSGRVLSADGRRRLDVTLSGAVEQPVELGCRAADELLAQGAAALVEDSRRT